MIREPYDESGAQPDPLLLARVTAPLWATALVGAGWVTGHWLGLPTPEIGAWAGAGVGAAVAALTLFALVVESKADRRARRPSPSSWFPGPDGR